MPSTYLRDLQCDVHPDFSTSIYPFGSIEASRFVFHLCLLLSLVNNHARLLFYAYYLRIQLCLIHGHVLHGAPAFIQHKHSQLNYRTPSPKAHNRPPSASSCLLPRTTRHLQRSRGFARCPNALLLLVLFCPVLFSGCWFLLEIIKQRY